ncbi:MAG: HNH endonuclease [Pedosphaera sp.]|nr:HNH endonuclease [Pedosphaera sp.]
MNPPAVRQEARRRAGVRCEYCRFHERHLPLWPFHLEHIVAEQHGGTDDLDNLAWSCQRCNLRKGTNLSSIDPDTRTVVRVFHPRSDTWEQHFAMTSDGKIQGLTSVGRATAWLFQMNSTERVELRRLLFAQSEW